MTTAEVKDEAARTWFGSTISSTQLPSRVAHWFLLVARRHAYRGMGAAGGREVELPEITMQPGGRSALTGFSPFPTQ